MISSLMKINSKDRPSTVDVLTCQFISNIINKKNNVRSLWAPRLYCLWCTAPRIDIRNAAMPHHSYICSFAAVKQRRPAVVAAAEPHQNYCGTQSDIYFILIYVMYCLWCYASQSDIHNAALPHHNHVCSCAAMVQRRPAVVATCCGIAAPNLQWYSKRYE